MKKKQNEMIFEKYFPPNRLHTTKCIDSMHDGDDESEIKTFGSALRLFSLVP